MAKGTKPVVERGDVIDVRPVDLKIAVDFAGLGKAETCCNYHIAGKAGDLLLVLPPMTHVQDMER
ncbi:MAG: hypothetical protein KDJ16_11230 [Hyphomicrobiales bacterium]|nr:hypothetical protein [Hyphomicrobiales bacterium]